MHRRDFKFSFVLFKHKSCILSTKNDTLVLSDNNLFSLKNDNCRFSWQRPEFHSEISYFSLFQIARRQLPSCFEQRSMIISFGKDRFSDLSNLLERKKQACRKFLSLVPSS